jgi:hypothetical protein
VALAKLLRGLAKRRPALACTVETEVETPNDVFDTYGRFIGTIYVRATLGRVDDGRRAFRRQLGPSAAR